MTVAREKVVLGLSGGVDSAVAALMLKERGYEVTGVFLSQREGDGEAAGRAAEELGIGFDVVDMSRELEEKVCVKFAESYLRGRTPNPCVICNPGVKFPMLISAAERHGAKYVATGHYASVSFDGASGRYQLRKAASGNDQSYMLCRLTQDILSRVIFPLGSGEKDEVRRVAAENGLTSAGAPDSMEICFVPDNDYAAWLDSRGISSPPGDFVDRDGKVIGRHEGITRYTVGKRRGLRIAAGERLYVSEIDAGSNRITLVPESGLYIDGLYISGLNWVSVAEMDRPFEAMAKLRHSKREERVTAVPEGERLFLRFACPVRRPAPGQFAAIYSEDGTVLCSGEIE